MIRATLFFILLALLPYAFGFYEVRGMSFEVGETVLLVFVLLALALFIARTMTKNRSRFS